MLHPATSPSDALPPLDDDEPSEVFIGNGIADEDAPSGPDEVDRLAGRILRAERRLRMIEQLSERSLALACLTHDRAMDDGRRAAAAAAAGEPERPSAANPPAAPNPDASAATYAKLSRTVRLCLDMEARADQALATLQDGAPAVRAARETRLGREAKARREKVKDEVLSIMEPVVREASDSEAKETELFAAAIERMEFDPAYDDLEGWDALVTVARLCENLGLKPDWNAWTRDGWPRPEGFERPAWSPFNCVSAGPVLEPMQAAIWRAARNRLE